MKKKVLIALVVSLLLTMAVLAASASDGSVSIWQIGQFDGKKDEFFTTSHDYDFVTTFTVGATATDLFPAEIRSSDASTTDGRYPYSTNSVDIVFEVDEHYTNATLQYTRMGGEVDWIHYDGRFVGQAGPAPDDPYPATDYFALPGGLFPGTHTIRIIGQAKPDYADGYHWVDALKLTADPMAMSVEDCTPGSYDGYIYADKRFVSAYGSGASTPVESFGPLVPGLSYRIEASGTYYAGGNTLWDIEADAEYSQDMHQRINGLGWTDLVRGYEGYGESLLELKVDGGPVEWGEFSADHVYTFPWTGTGEPLTLELQIYDIYAQNNTGGLCAALFYCQPSVVWLPPITLPDWTLNENATLPIKFQLQDCSGNILTTDLGPLLNVAPGGSQTDLRFDGEEYHYIANFRPELSDGHTAVVSLDGVELDSKSFVVVEAGKANGRGRGNN